MQCPKLRVHPVPVVHISTAGCTIFGGVHPVCARFFEPVDIALYNEGAWRNSPAHSFRRSAPCGRIKLNLNFGHCYVFLLDEKLDSPY